MSCKPNLLLIFLFSQFIFILRIQAQNYNSSADGTWSNPRNWQNTSGHGPATPQVNGSYGTRNLNHNQTIFNDYSTGSSTLNISYGTTLTVRGNYTALGGSRTFVSGTLIITENLILRGAVNVLPGGKLIVQNNIEVNNSEYLTIGTDAQPEPYADLIVNGDLNSFNSGDINVKRNGRAAIFGSVNDNGGGGTILRLDDGGQMFINEEINYSGGGSSIRNNNSTDPYGLYVNGPINNRGGGANTSTNTGDQQTMRETNPDFFDWVGNQENSPLPISLASFKALKSSQNIDLNWVTTQEHNFSHFQVERSFDQKSWHAIGSVQGMGESNGPVHYKLTDRNVPFGMIYYRLKAVDIDDSFEYSSITMIKKGFEGKLKVAPNPVKDVSNIKIQVPSNYNGKLASVSLFELSGIKVEEFKNFDTERPLRINSQLRSGMYILKINHNGLQENISIIIQ